MKVALYSENALNLRVFKDAAKEGGSTCFNVIILTDWIANKKTLRSNRYLL